MDRFRNSTEQLWLGYEVPALPQSHLSTCSNWSDPSAMDDGCCGEYRLEETNYSMNRGDHAPPVQNIYVFLRLDHDQLTRIRPVMAGCRLDAGGVPLHVADRGPPEESISFLAQLATQASASNSSHIVDGALLSISYHATSEATSALAGIASSTAPMHVREQAAFWLGVQRGHEGFIALQEVEKKTTDASLRERHLISRRTPTLRLKTNCCAWLSLTLTPKFVNKHFFWLAQKAGKKATGAITDAIENDPETDVKKKAVFALSQLPKDESVPQLIHVADTNSNPAIRKEAFFWLGQSHDPRALAYLEQVLRR